MAQVNISLPPALKDHVDGTIAAGHYASPSDYIRDLIRRDRNQKDRLSRLRAAIDHGRASGVSTRTLEDIYAANRARRDAA